MRGQVIVTLPGIRLVVDRGGGRPDYGRLDLFCLPGGPAPRRTCIHRATMIIPKHELRDWHGSTSGDGCCQRRARQLTNAEKFEKACESEHQTESILLHLKGLPLDDGGHPTFDPCLLMHDPIDLPR